MRLEHLEPRVHLSVARPSYNTGTGFFVSGGQVYDANGEAFVIRGVNQNHWWGNAAENFAAIDHVAKTGSNAVRAVFNKDLPGITTSSGSDTPAERRAIVEEILSNNMVPIVEDHAVTNATYVNDPNGLHQVVTNWLDPANVSWLRQYERTVILNIANEWGPPQTGTNHVWRDSYITQVQRLRAANVNALIMIDAGGWGQDPHTIRNDAAAVLAADPQHNVVFSSHFYGNWRTEDRAFDVTPGGPYDVLTHLTAVRNAGLPIVVGEFSWESLDFATYRTRRVMEICHQLGIGYLGWGWNHNSPAGLNMLVDNLSTGSVEYQYNTNADLTQWGDLIVNDPDYGIKATAVRATVFPPEAPRLILERTSVLVPETGHALARVRLSKAPATDVTVALAKLAGGDANLALAGPAGLTFTPGNWDRYQTVVLTASADADTAPGTARFQLAGAGLQAVDFLARELDANVPTGTFTLTPTHDRDTQSDNAAGTNATVSASKWNHIYQKYDLSGVGGRVTSAVLRVYKTQATSNLTGRVWLSLDDNWTQATAPASLPGLSYPVLSQVMPNGAGYVEFDVTGLVNGEVLGDRTATIGITTASDNWTAFNTKEAATAFRPQLVVTSVPAVLPPTVTDVYVASTAWTPAYRNSLAAGGTGEAAFGYRINPAEQTRTLAWTNLNQVSVRFSGPVTLSGGDDLIVNGVNVPSYLLANGGVPTYDPATFTATWTLATPIRNDKVTLRLDGDDGTDGMGIRDAGDRLLDGEWANPIHPSFSNDTFPSGNGVAGGDFVFTIRVLPGDVNRDGAVNVYDYNVMRLNMGLMGKGVTGGDINGDNLVSLVDYNEYRTYLNKTAPAHDPISILRLRPDSIAERQAERLAAKI